MGRALKKLLGVALTYAGLFFAFWVIFLGLWFAIAAVQSLGQ